MTGQSIFCELDDGSISYRQAMSGFFVSLAEQTTWHKAVGLRSCISQKAKPCDLHRWNLRRQNPQATVLSKHISMKVTEVHLQRYITKKVSEVHF